VGRQGSRKQELRDRLPFNPHDIYKRLPLIAGGDDVVDLIEDHSCDLAVLLSSSEIYFKRFASEKLR
jgi:hypothetical protein